MLLPVLGREIPMVADEFVDREFGTGAVKITPAHDPNDFAAAQRLGLPSINIMDERAVLNENAGPYAGQDRFEARKGIVAQLETEGLLVKTEPHPVPLGHCQRCDTIVEPRLSRQWFVKIEPLAEPAIWPRWRTAASASCPRAGPRPTSSGCATSATGASRASSGGDIASRPGPARSATS